MIIFPKMKTDKGFITSEIVVESKTLPKEMYPKWNRKERRAAIFAKPVERLMRKITLLRKDMIQSGIEPIPFAKNAMMNRNALSGHMSQLHNQINA